MLPEGVFVWKWGKAMNRIGLIGAGVVGSALADWLAKQGFQISAVSSRNQRKAEQLAGRLDAEAMPWQQVASACELLFIATADDAIAKVCANVASYGFGGCQAVFHLSGALGSEILAPAAQAGLGVASIHPLGSFAELEQARELLPHCWFTIEGNSKGIVWAERVLRQLGARFRQLEREKKPRYHLAAVFASNYLLSLLSVAAELWQELGLKPEEGLWQLADGTIANARKYGIGSSLTGPIKRGDLETVALHMAQLKDKPCVLRLYRQLGLQALKLSGLGAERKRSLATLLGKEDFK
jgi:predicted short-subunit dehydrogenase-like oxidoreductase (DUF2520 family)